MIPLLWELKEKLTEDAAREQHFVAQMVALAGSSENQVFAAIDNWKKANKWKRRIDDRNQEEYQKAYRMIYQHMTGHRVTRNQKENKNDKKY